MADHLHNMAMQQHPSWYEAIIANPEALNALLAIGAVFVGLAGLFWLRKLVVALVTLVTLLLGVMLVLVAVFGPILGLIDEPAPAAQTAIEETTNGINEGIDEVQEKLQAVRQIQQGIEVLQDNDDGGAAAEDVRDVEGIKSRE